MTDATLLGANFQLDQILPSQLGVPKLNDSSVVLGKQVSTYFPQTSQSQTIPAGTSGSPFIVKLSNSRMYGDLRSARLNFSLVLQPNAGTVAPDDSAFSVIQRIRVLVSGVLVEDIQYANIVAALKHAFCYGQDNTVDQLICGWKYNTQQYGEQTLPGVAYAGNTASGAAPLVGGAVPYNFPYTNAAADTRGQLAVSNLYNQAGNTLQVSLPLRMISGFFNSKQFYYTRNASIQLEIYPEVPAQALVAVVQAAGQQNGTSYQMNSVTLRMDEYSVDSSVVDMIDSVIASAGMVVPFETYSVLNANYNGTTLALPFTRSVSDLLEAWFVAQPQANFSQINNYSVSGFPTHGLDQCQWQLGSTLFPVTPTTSDTERNYLVLQTANGDPAAEYSMCQLPRCCLSCYGNATPVAGVYPADGDMVISAFAYPFRKINTENCFSISAGVNTGLDSGSIICRFVQSQASATATYGYCILKYVRLLTLASGRVSVSA